MVWVKSCMATDHIAVHLETHLSGIIHLLLHHNLLMSHLQTLMFWRRNHNDGVGGITVPSINRLWSPVWRLSTCLESGIIYDILFNMQNPSKILLKLKLGNSKVLQITS